MLRKVAIHGESNAPMQQMEQGASWSPLCDDGQVGGLGARPHEHDDIGMFQALTKQDFRPEFLYQAMWLVARAKVRNV